MLTFPRAQGRILASSTSSIAAGAAHLSLGRLPLTAHWLIVTALRTPVSRRLVGTTSFEPACGWDVFDEATSGYRESISAWAFLASPWGKPRVHALGLDGSAQPKMFLTLEPADPPRQALPMYWDSFRVPEELRTVTCRGWLLFESSVLPAYHRPMRWEPGRLTEITEEINGRLRLVLPRPPGIPRDYLPAHGDFVPWNVRRSSSKSVWVIDWEDACWAPPHADLVRFAVAVRSLRRRHGDDLAGTRRLLAALPRDQVARAADFWLRHRNLSTGSSTATPSASAMFRRTARENRILEGLRA